MGDVTLVYGTADQAITITVASLATSTARESTAIDNTSNKFLDILVELALKLQAGTPGSDKQINVYVYGSQDGTDYDDNATGTDAAVTLRSPTNLRLAAVILTPDSGGLTYRKTFSLAAAFGGLIPRKWGIVVENRTNIALSATGGDHTAVFTGIKENVA